MRIILMLYWLQGRNRNHAGKACNLRDFRSRVGADTPKDTPLKGWLLSDVVECQWHLRPSSPQSVMEQGGEHVPRAGKVICASSVGRFRLTPVESHCRRRPYA